MTNIIKIEKKCYIIFVESNGNGHVTQMKHIIELLKKSYKCVGIVIGREKRMASEYAKNHNIPILNLHEPKYVSDENIDALVNDTIAYLLEYSYFQYPKVVDFVLNKSPEFIINLHLPIKLMCAATRTVFHISTQNRINFDVDYDSIIAENVFEKFTTNSVLFSSYLIHKSHLRMYKIAIDCVPNLNKNIDLCIPPLIKNSDLSSRLENSIVCYFNVPPNVSVYGIMEMFLQIEFYIYLSFLPKDSILQKLPKNVHLQETGDDFVTRRARSIGVISSCGVETVYETFLLGLPMVCIPSNSEQLFNAYDHSRKIPGFKWAYNLNKEHISWLVEFKHTNDYWLKHNNFKTYMKIVSPLETFINDTLR